MYIQRLWERYPNHIDHQDQTIKDHTWALHEELLEHDQNSVCYQEFQWLEIAHHAGKRFLTQPSEVHKNISLNILNPIEDLREF